MSAVVPQTETVSDSPAPSDADLVERFLTARDQPAFAELVRRHSGIVLGVCRRALVDANDIDDAFQATFLVLVRDMAKIRKRASLASWLYGVAYRLSLGVARSKQLRRETGLVDQTTKETDLFESLAGQHDRQSLDDELNGLPERYRQVLVLRYLVGKSTSEIASELKTTVGSVEGLLKRGKDELGSRLLKRGVSLGAALIAIQTAQQAVNASVSHLLIDHTIQAGLGWNIMSNTAPDDLVSSRVAELATKEIIAMTATATTKTTMTLGLAIGGLLVGMSGVGLMYGTNRGTAEAAGLGHGVSTISAIGHEVEMAAFAADPAEKKKDTAKPATTEKKAAGLRLSGKVHTSGNGTVSNNVAEPATKKWDFSIRTPRVQEIEKELQTLTEVDFVGCSLKEAVDTLKGQHQIDIQFDRKALEDQGITTDLQVDLILSGVTLRSALRQLLELHDLEYVIKHDTLTITSGHASEHYLETKIYDVRRTGIKSQKSLIEMIINTVKGDRIKWKTDNLLKLKEMSDLAVSSDGEGGMIQPLEHTLVIRQTNRAHEEIVELLDQLERMDQETRPKK